MADKVIGLDVGTNAVRAAEVALGSEPRLLRFGQVALPPDAVAEGEVVNPGAVAEALRRLWREVGFRNRSVRVGLASARVILRVVEVPELSEEDTRSALALQLGEYVPMAAESTVFGFQAIAGPDGWAGGPAPDQGGAAGPESEGGGGEPAPDTPGEGAGEATWRQQRLLLAAAHRDAVTPLVEAVRQAGLKVAAVDVIPAALARALSPATTEGVGPPPVEAIVSLGAGTTVVVVVRAGTPLFTRTVTSVSGRLCTDRLAEQLGMAPAQAERAKRLASIRAAPPPPFAPDGTAASPGGPATGGATTAETLGDALAAARPVVAELVAEVADSLDYYASQPGALSVERVLLTGGGMLLHGAAEELEERLALPVVPADPQLRVEGVPAGFEPVDLPFLAPYLPAAVGLALGGGRTRGARIDLAADAARPGAPRRPLRILGAAAAAVSLLAASGLYWQRRGEIGRQERATEAARQELSALSAAASSAATSTPAGADPATVLRAALRVDPDWLAAAMRLDQINAGLGVTVVSVKGAMASSTSGGTGGSAGPGGAAAATTTTTAAPAVDPATGAVLGAPLGTLSITARAPDLAAVAAWLDALESDVRFASPWVGAIAPQDGGLGSSVQFTAEVQVTGENLVPRTLRESPR